MCINFSASNEISTLVESHYGNSAALSVRTNSYYLTFLQQLMLHDAAQYSNMCTHVHVHACMYVLCMAMIVTDSLPCIDLSLSVILDSFASLFVKP